MSPICIICFGIQINYFSIDSFFLLLAAYMFDTDFNPSRAFVITLTLSAGIKIIVFIVSIIIIAIAKY